MPTFPKWWNWDLSFTAHAELRMEQRGVTEVEVRAMLERANGVRGQCCREQIHGPNPTRSESLGRDREPDAEANLLVVVTVYEVSQ